MEMEKKTTPSSKLSPALTNILIVAAMFVAAVFLWNTFVLYPVKMFVVLLHEMSHGLAAITAGGRIVSIQLDPHIGGYCKFALPAARAS